jgi:acyl-CoA synthetase (AMP-forming)/AMP-acid ligase II
MTYLVYPHLSVLNASSCVSACALIASNHPKMPGSSAPAVLNIDEEALRAAAVRERGALLEEPDLTKDERGPDASSGALLLYTSGTTSKPKGVLHTYRSIGAQIQALTKVPAHPTSNINPAHPPPSSDFQRPLHGYSQYIELDRHGTGRRTTPLFSLCRCITSMDW